MTAWLGSVMSGRSKDGPLDCVRVWKADLTESSFARATLDQFTAGTLTVSSLDTGDEIKTYVPGTWREAVGYDARGNTAIAFDASQED